MSTSLPALSGDKDHSLTAALTPFLSEYEAAHDLGSPLTLADPGADRDAEEVEGMLRRSRDFDPHVTAVRKLAAMEAAYASFPEMLDARLVRALAARGIDRLYTHQAEAIDHALGGRHVVVVTPTASGKTLCYNAPVLHGILQDPSARALYLFPTKALAQDQLAELQQMATLVAGEGADPVGVFTYDGDTPQDARRAIRARAHVVLSNPDMLHSGILPHHPR